MQRPSPLVLQVCRARRLHYAFRDIRLQSTSAASLPEESSTSTTISTPTLPIEPIADSVEPTVTRRPRIPLASSWGDISIPKSHEARHIIQPDPAPGNDYPDLTWINEGSQEESLASRLAKRLERTDMKEGLSQRLRGQPQAKEIAQMYQERNARILERKSAAAQKQLEYEEKIKARVKVGEERQKAYEERMKVREERQKEYEARVKAREERQKDYEARVGAREERQKAYEARVKGRAEARGGRQRADRQNRSSGREQHGAVEGGDYSRSPVWKIFGVTDLNDLFHVPRTETLIEATGPVVVHSTQDTLPPVSESTDTAGATPVAQAIEGVSAGMAPSVDIITSDLSHPVDVTLSVHPLISKATSSSATTPHVQSQRKVVPVLSTGRDRLTTIRNRHSLRHTGGDYSRHLPSKLVERGGDFRKLGPVNYARLTLARRRDLNMRSKLVGAGIIAASAKSQGQAVRTTS